MSDETYGLLLPFDVDDPEFCRGVEVGHVWTMLRHTDEREFTCHAANAEMLIRIGEALDLPFSAEAGDDDGHWLFVTYGADP
jgi:hypothetical protein